MSRGGGKFRIMGLLYLGSAYNCTSEGFGTSSFVFLVFPAGHCYYRRFVMLKDREV